MTRRVLEVAISSQVAGQRLDAALARELTDLSRSALARLIEDGYVRVDGELVTKRATPVRLGARIEVEIPSPVESGIESQDLPLEILHEDESIAVINKPAGIVVHPAAGHHEGTLVNALLFHVKDLSGVGGEVRPGIVHRLDKDTSGVMIVAKHDRAHRRLTAAWGTSAVQKDYLAVVYGTPRQTSGTIDEPIGRDPRNRKRMAVVAGGKPASTTYRVIEPLSYVSLVRCRIHTGRTHQIRVHLKNLGHPIVGDAVYSGPQWRGIPDKRIQKLLAAFGRQALHAEKLTFPHPETGAAMTFEAPLPEDMRALLQALRAI